MNKLLFGLIILTQSLVGCNQFRLYMREIPLEVTDAVPDPASPEVRILVPVSDSYINSNNKNSITIGGSCSENGQEVSVSVVGGSTITFNPVCSSKLWAVPSADLSTLSDGPVTITADHQDAQGNVAATATKHYVKDTVIPLISSVSSNSSTGNYAAGTDVNVTLNFSESVKVTGIPKIALNTVPSRFANYVSGTGTSSLVFKYTVQTGDQATRLDYPDVDSLRLETGVAISDIAGNGATALLPDPAAAADGLYDKNITVDASNLTLTLNQDSSQADPTNALPIVFKAVFSRAIGPASFTVSDISQTGTATATSWSITNPSADNMTFFLSAGTISGSGTIVPSITAGKVQTSTGVGNDGSVSSDHTVTYDITTPVVTTVTTTNPSGYYTTGSVINVVVNFSESVTVDSSGGIPFITLNTVPSHVATYVSGSGTGSLLFQYLIQAGDADARVDYASTAALALSGSTIRDSVGNDAVLDLPSTGSSGLYQQNLVIDTSPLSVSVNQGGSQNDPTNALPVVFDVAFNKAISVASFTASDIVQSGTASGITWSITDSGNHRNFTLNATAVSGSGTLVPSIQADQVQDAAGNKNTASSSSDHSVVYDTQPLLVTVNQGATQPDPTNSTSVVFNVIFSKAIDPSTFDSSDLSNSGTSLVSGWSISNPSNDQKTYQVTTTGITGSGTIIPSILSGKVKDLALNANTSSTSIDHSVTFDNIAPVIASVSTTTPSGTFSDGSIINVTLNFSENVTVDTSTGVPVISLGTSPSRNAVYSSGSGTSSLVFNYTVQAGDQAARLDYDSNSALNLNSGVISDLAGNASVNSLPTVAGSNDGLFTQNIVIDTGALNVTVDQLLVQADPTKSAPISYNVVFSKPIDLTTFTVADITQSGTATVSGWTITNPSSDKKNFVLTADTVSTNGTVIPSIAANKVKDSAGNDNNASTVIADHSVTYDTVVPTITSIDTTSSTGTYGGGAIVNVTVNFSEVVQVLTTGGIPRIALNTTPSRYATYVSGSGTDSLVFEYTVQSGDGSTRLDYVSASALELNGGVIQDLATNAAVLTLPSTGSNGLYTKNIKIDTNSLSVTVNQAASQIDPTNSSTVIFDVAFSSQINQSSFVAADITNAGTSTVSGWTITNPSSDGKNFKITTTGLTGEGTVIPSIAAGLVQDLTGNTNNASTSNDHTVTYDATAPTITSVTSTTNSGTYTTGASVNVTVQFSESVLVSTSGGTPSMVLNTTPSRSATYVSGSGTSSLVFTYNVQAGDLDSRVDYASTSALALNGGTIQDSATNNASLALPATGSSGLYNKNIVIDTSALTVTLNQASSQPDPTNSASIVFDVVFNKAINAATFTGADLLNSGTAAVTGWSITNPSSDNKTFVVTTSGITGNGTIVPSVSASSVQDLAGNGNAASSSTDHSVTYETVSPTVISVTSTTASGTYTTAAVINVTVNFSESVTVSTSGGTPVLSLNTTPARNATYVSGSGTSALVFEYGVQAGDTDSRIDYTGTDALALSGGTIKDAATNPAILTLPATGINGLYNQNIKVDTVPLSVTVNHTGLQADPTNSALITFDVIFSKAINVSTFTAADITNSGSSTVNGWTITNPSGDQKSLVITTTGLTGDGTVVPSLAQNVVQDAAGNNNSSSTSTDNTVTYDSTAPTTITVTTSTASGVYSTGSAIDVTLNFSEVVNVVTTNGTPSVSLNTTPSRSATYVSGSGTNALRFRYTVQSGDSDVRVDYTGTGALSLNGGTINDAASNSAALTLPATGTNGLYNQNIKIDTSPLTVTVNQLLVQADPANSLPITYNVVFNKAINSSTFTTADITQNGTANVTGWSIANPSNDQINFELTATTVTSDGTVVPSIALNKVQDLAGNNNTASTSADNSVSYDGTAPTITSVTSTTSAGYYTTGASINVTVNFSETVTVNTSAGTPSITLNTTPSRAATYVSGTGTSTLVFNYTVQAGDQDIRVDYASTAALALNGGTIQDASTNNATLTLPATATSGLYTQNIVIDTSALTLTVNQGASQVDPTNSAAIVFDVVFNKAINGTTFTSSDISNAGTATVSDWTITNPSGDLKTYVITTSGIFGNGTVIPSVAGSMVQDVAGNTNTASTSTDSTVTRDTVAPTVLSVTTTTASGSYTTGAVINATVTFSETVSVNDTGGTPSITLNTTPSRTAAYVSGSGTSALVFQYTVQSGDLSGQLDYGSTASFSLNGGTIKDAATNNATLTLPATTTSGFYTQNIKIDTTNVGITINQKLVQADPTKAIPISFDVVFSKAINASTFTTSDITQSGTATGVTWSIANSGDNINFVLNATAVASDGTVVPTIASNMVKDTVGNDNSASTSTDNSVRYDTTAPQVTTVTSTTATGNYSTGSVINVTVNFGEAVTVDSSGGIPRITLNTSPSRYANYVSGSGTTSLVFSYAVQEGDSSTKLDYSSTSSLALNGAVIQDAATNGAILVLPAVGSSGLFSHNIVIDTAAPTVVISSTTSANPTTKSPIAMTVTFSENVTGFDSTDLTVSGGAVSGFSATSASVYTFNFTPTSNSSGSFTIDVEANAAIDGSSNNSTVATQFSRTYYTKTPTLTGTSPTNTTTPVLTVGNIISGLTANLYKNSACSVTADASATSGGTSQTVTSTTISASTNYYADVTDSQGNKSACSAVFALTFDNTAPTIAISSPTTNSFISAATDTTAYTVSGTCSEASQTVTIYLDGTTNVGTASCTGTTFSNTAVNTTVWSEGTHTLTASISDLAGNTTTSSSITVKRDVTAPSLPNPIAWSVAGTATNSTSITASWTKSASSDLNNQKIQLYTGSACNTVSGTLIDLSSAALQTKAFTGTNGTTYTYKLTSIDLAGNSSVSNCSSSLLVDTTQPFSSTSLGWNGATSPSTTAALTATWVKSTSADAVNQKILFYSDGVCGTQIDDLIDLGSAATQSYTFTAPGNGTYSFDINTYDAAGNVSNSGCSSLITVALPPLVMSPGNFNYPAGKTETVTFTASGGSGSGYTYSVESGPGTINGSTGVYNGGTSRVPGGTATVVKVTDSAGTSVTTTITHIAMAVNGTVNASATDGNGNIYVGGAFSAVNMDYASGFMPVSSTTGNINDYGLASAFSSGAKINAILISGTSAFIGGLFNSYRGTTVQNLVKINLSTGALDTTFTQTTGPTAEVSSLAINGSALYVGGYFDGYRSTASGLRYLIKVDTTSGNLDTGFVSTCYANAGVNSIFALVVANGGLYVGGQFQGYAGGTSANTAIKVDLANGTLTDSYQRTTAGPNGAVLAMAVTSSYLYLGGSFAQWKNGSSNDTNYTRLVRINLSTSTLDTGFMGAGKNPNGTVRALALSSDETSIYAGGDFSLIGTNSKGTYLAKLNATTGVLDTTNFNSYVIAAGSAVNSLLLNGSSLYVGGSFSAYRSSSLGKGLIKVDAITGVMDTTNFNTVKTGPNGTINTIALSGSTLYAGGSFTYYRGTYVENLAKFSLSNWALDTTFTQSTGPDDTVRAIAVSGSSVYVGGDFVNYRGDSKGYRLAKLDTTNGNMDTAAFNTVANSGPENGNVFSILVNGNDLYIGGAFNSYRGSNKGYFVAKLNANTGEMDTTNFNTTAGSGPNNTVYAMAFNPAKTKIYLGGLFTSYRLSVYGNFVIAINPSDGTYDTTVICGSGNGTPNGAVYAIAVSGTTSSFSVYLGGNFTQYNSNSKGSYLVKVSSTGVMDLSFNSTTSNNGPGAYVNAIAPSLDGSYLYVGGAFTTYKNNNKGYYVAKVSTSNAALETTNFNTTANTGPNGIINSILLSSDGSKIYVGGAHSSYRGSVSVPFMTSVSTTNGATSY